LVWRFRAVTTNHVTLGGVSEANSFLTNPPPLIIVLPTKDLTRLTQTNCPQIQVHGFDMVRCKEWGLTALIR